MTYKEEQVRLQETLASATQLREIQIQAAVDARCRELHAQIQALELRNVTQQSDAREALAQAVLDKERLKADTMHASLQHQQEQMNELRETLLAKKTASSVGLGQEGERYFEELARATFAHLDVFEIQDVSKTPHSGDFHCVFDGFTVLCDTKNFVKGRVSTHDVGKFHFDMAYNAHIQVGWLVCLTGYVAGRARRPFVLELRDGKLMCYINNLKNQENPAMLLLDAHYACEFVYHTVLNTETQADELEKYKKYAGRIGEGLKRALKSSKRAIDHATQGLADLTDHHRGLTEMLQDNILSVRQSDVADVEEWLRRALQSNEGGKLRSNALYERFRRDTPTSVMTNEAFKTVLKTALPADRLQLPKHDKSQYVILGYAWVP